MYSNHLRKPFKRAIILIIVLMFCFPELTLATQDPFRSAAEVNYPPFSFINDAGRADGFAVELLQAALGAMGRKATFRTGPWSEVRSWLAQGKVQALPLVGRTPERENLFDFTFPYMSIHGAIVVRTGNTDIQNLDDLRGHRVAVMQGDNAEEFLRRKDRGLEIHTTRTFEQALIELSQGRHDAVVIQRLVALRLLQKTGLTNVKVLNKPIEGFRQDFCFAVQEGDKETLALLNEGLSLVMAGGTYRHLHAKWFAALQLPSHRRIVIGGDHNYPPFEYLNEDGAPVGYNVAITRAIANEVGLDIEIRLGPWAKIRQELAEGQIDAIQGMLYSTKRDLSFDFTPPYTVNHYVAVVRKGEGPPPVTTDELQGRRIVVQQGDIMHDLALERGLEEHMTTVEAQEDALRELVAGRRDCALVARLTALYWMEKKGWDNLLIGQRPLLSPGYGLAVPHNQKALLAQFSEGLKLIEKTGEYQRIRENWLGIYDDFSLDVTDVFRYLAIVLIPCLVLLVVFLFWSWSLRRQVAARTRELQRSTEFQRAMIACSPVALYSIDFEGRVSNWNASAERIFGWKEEEVLDKPLPIFPDDKKQEFDNLRQRISAGKTFEGIEVIRKKKDGTLFTGSLSAAPLKDPSGKPFGIMSAMEDITQRKEAEQALRRSEALLNTAQRISKIGGWEWDVLKQEMYWTAETYRLHDIDPHERYADGQAHIAKSIECYSQEDQPRIHNAFKRCADHGISYDLVCSFTTMKGRHKWIRTSGEAVWEGKQIIKVHGNIQDITEQKQVEQHLYDQNQFIQTILDNLPIGLAVNSIEDGKVTYMNKQFEEIYGWPKEVLEDRETFFKKVYPDKAYRQEIRTKVMQDIQSGNSDQMRWDNIQVTGRDGQTKYVSARNFPLYTQGLMISTVQDITESKQLEAQLIQAQKMESVGRLAGGVAHDYNNMLSVIIMNTKLALEEVEQQQPIQENLEDILAAAERSAEITQQLLAFARKQAIAPRILDLNETVEGMLKMLSRLIGEDLDLEWLPGEAVRPVRIDPSQVNQILANLCVNARDAIQGTGKLTIETANVRFDEAYCAEQAEFFPGEYVLLAVSDDGCGMDKDTLDRVFEPFFSTKEIGKGSGLGLATVYGIVKQNQGFINIYSEPGQGTSIKIYLPCQTGELQTASPEKESEIPVGSGEIILVVEDEASIVKFIGKVLKKLNYEFLTAETPAEALELMKSHSGRIDLLLTDVVMPGMNGWDLAEELMKEYPDLKCLFMSGYTANVIAHHGVLDKDMHFIQKPFSLESLALKIREALES